MRYLVGMSGGLDSTWAARLLLDEGHEVEGCTLRFSPHTDLESARLSAEQLGIKLHIVDCSADFERFVVDNFVSEYARARTPNPCVMCNRYAKVEYLCRLAREGGFDRAVTGHYCEILRSGANGRYYVGRARDSRKDQSYVLWQLTQEQLALLETPLALLDKRDIRRAAADAGYTASAAGESQEICFIPSGDYASFIEERLGVFPEGDFIDKTGRVVGRHRGIIHYTIGQRKGLGLSMGAPVFITSIDPEANTITVAPAGGELTDRIWVSGLNFQLLEPERAAAGVSMPFLVKIRYAAAPVPAVAVFDGKGGAEVRFDSPVRAATPGQSAVFYSGREDSRLGIACGAFIDSAGR